MVAREWSRRTGRAATLAAAVAVGGGACGSPPPRPPALDVPKSTLERIHAMQVGPAPRATVAEITEASRVLDGPAATGAIGDWVMQNGRVMVVIARPDGSARGGAVVDLGAADLGADELASMETLVGGEPVIYSTLETGTDGSGGAFVDVLGHAGELAVSTRYELRPGLDAVLIHTSFVRPGTTGTRGEAAADRLLGQPGTEARCDPEQGKGQCELTSEERGYVLCALDLEGAMEHVEDGGAVVVGVDAAALRPGAQLYSRYLAVLDRADSLAVASSLAIARGHEVGEVELTLFPVPWGKGRVVEPGFFWLAPADGGVPLTLETRAQLHPGDRVIAKAPVGSWYVEFRNETYAGDLRGLARVEVVHGERAKVRVSTHRRATPTSR